MELEVRLHGTQAGGTLALEERDRAINHISRRALQEGQPVPDGATVWSQGFDDTGARAIPIIPELDIWQS